MCSYKVPCVGIKGNVVIFFVIVHMEFLLVGIIIHCCLSCNSIHCDFLRGYIAFLRVIVYDLLYRTGFSRLNFPYFMSHDSVDYIIKAVTMVAREGWKLLPLVCATYPIMCTNDVTPSPFSTHSTRRPVSSYTKTHNTLTESCSTTSPMTVARSPTPRPLSY